jgi:hypothetical protein
LLEFQDRCLYGRDQFDNEHQRFLNGLKLPEEVLRKIYRKKCAKAHTFRGGMKQRCSIAVKLIQLCYGTKISV